MKNNITKPWSWHVATVAGIPIRIHFTFALLVLFFGYLELLAGGNVIREMVFIIGVFFCVVLHELGHSLTAKGFGIKTDEIVLYPIGGVARLRNLGDSFQEFWITAAGPAVNVVLSFAFYGLLVLNGTGIPLNEISGETYSQMPLFQRLLIANIVLAVFNLIPAFPMDGGRLLRSSLSVFMSRIKATNIAVWVGRLIAMMFGVLGIFSGNFILLIIAVFIYFTGGQELKMLLYQDIFENGRAGDAMQRQFNSLNYFDTLQRAFSKTQFSNQYQFPVTDSQGQLVGVLNKHQIVTGLQFSGPDTLISSYVTRDFPVVSSFEQLATVIKIFQGRRSDLVVVVDQGQVAGLITPEILNQYIYANLVR